MQFKIINKNVNQAVDMPVVHADGRLDSVMVMGPRRPVYLRVGMRPHPDAFQDKNLIIREVESEAADKSRRQQLHTKSANPPAPAAAVADKAPAKAKAKATK